MDQSIHYVEGPTATDHVQVDTSRVERTVKLVVTGERAGGLYRGDVAKAIEETCPMDRLVGMWKGEQTNIWYVEVDNEYTADDIVSKTKTTYAGAHDRTIRAMWYDRQELLVRLHWLPTFVDNDYVNEIMSGYGEVYDIVMERQKVGDRVIETGDRTVFLIVTEQQRRVCFQF